MSFNKVQKIINLAYNFYRIASDDFEDSPSDWQLDQIRTGQYIKQIIDLYDGIKDLFDYVKTTANQKINVLDESDDNSIYEYYNEFLENIIELMSIAIIYEKEHIGYEDLKDKVEFIQSEYFDEEIVSTNDPKIKNFWKFVSEYVDSIEQNILNSEYLKNKAIENNTLDISHESSEEYQEIKNSLKDDRLKELIFGEGESRIDLGSGIEEDPKGKGSGISIRSADHVDLAEKNMEKFIEKKSNIYNDISSYLINLNKKYKLQSLKAVEFDSSGDVQNIDNLNVNQLIQETKDYDDFAKNSAKLIKAKLDQYRILIEIEDNYPRLRALLDDLKAKVRSISENDWFGTDESLSNFKVDTQNTRDQNKKLSQGLFSNNKKIQLINQKIELLESNPAGLSEENKKSINNLKIKRTELSDISKQLKDQLNKIKEKNKLNAAQYMAVNKQPGTFAYYKNRLNKIKSNLTKTYQSTNNIVEKRKAEQVLAEVNQSLKEVEEQTQQITEVDSFIKNNYVQKLRNIENRVVKPLQVQLEGVSYPENVDLKEIDQLINSIKFDPNAFNVQLNLAKNKILSNIDNVAKILADPKYNKGLSSGSTIEKFKKLLKDEINSIKFDPKNNYNKDQLNIILNKLKNINNRVMNQFDSAGISSAYKSKSFVGLEGKELAKSDLAVALDKIQNTVSTKITNEFPYAAMRNKAFKTFIESDGFKKVLEKRKSLRSEILSQITDSEKRVNELKKNFSFTFLARELTSLVFANINLIKSNQKSSANDKQKNLENIANITNQINKKLDLYLESNSQDASKVNNLRAIIKDTNLTADKFREWVDGLARDFFRDVKNTISLFFVKYKESNIGLDGFSEFYIKYNEFNSELLALKNLIKMGSVFLVSTAHETEKEVIDKINSFTDAQRSQLTKENSTTNSDIIKTLGLVGKNKIKIDFNQYKQGIEKIYNSIREDNTFDNLKFDLRIYDINTNEGTIDNFIKEIEHVFSLLEAYIQKLNIYEKAYRMAIGKAPVEELKPAEELSDIFNEIEEEDFSGLDEIDFETVNQDEESAKEPQKPAEFSTTKEFDEMSEEEQEYIDSFYTFDEEDNI